MKEDLEAYDRQGEPEPEATMPDWWPVGKPPERLNPKYIYIGNDGRWHRSNGVIVTRADRRKAHVRNRP